MTNDQIDAIVKKHFESCANTAASIVNSTAQSNRAQITVLLTEVANSLAEKLKLELAKKEAVKDLEKAANDNSDKKD